MGESLAISVPAGDTRVLKHFQERIPYGLFVPDGAPADNTAIQSKPRACRGFQVSKLKKVLAGGGSKTNAPHPRLLRVRRERPSSCRTAEERDERAAPHHSIILSARSTSPAGTS
jgi:hypothetical protein